MSRSWAKSQSASQTYRLTPDKEAAKWLRLAADRYVNDRANAGEVAEAYQAFIESLTKREAVRQIGEGH